MKGIYDYVVIALIFSRFIAPTQNFFMTLYYEWNHLKQVETDSEEVHKMIF